MLVHEREERNLNQEWINVIRNSMLARDDKAMLVLQLHTRQEQCSLMLSEEKTD